MFVPADAGVIIVDWFGLSRWYIVGDCFAFRL
jgi:hypothetical protein